MPATRVVTGLVFHACKRHARSRVLSAPGEAWARGKRCEVRGAEGRKRKPFSGTLRVANPVRPSWPNSRNRVLRGCGVTRSRNRTQGVHRPCDGASKVTRRECRRLDAGAEDPAQTDGVRNDSRSARSHRLSAQRHTRVRPPRRQGSFFQIRGLTRDASGRRQQRENPLRDVGPNVPSTSPVASGFGVWRLDYGGGVRRVRSMVDHGKTH